ncbi:MAG TPA: hypothetical protein VF997_08170 [Polyangia bacterium]
MTLAGALLAAAPAHAQIQTKGPEVFTGKLQIGFHPIGFQTGFNGQSPSGYKLTADIAGLIASPGKLSLWLGGGVGYAAGFYSCYVVNGVSNCGGDLQLWAFVMLTFEKLLPIPLVPFARAGVGGDVLFYGNTAGAFVLRVGGGVHYYLLKWLGLGLETNFTFGPGFYGGGAGTLFYGNWDFGLGARFAF